MTLIVNVDLPDLAEAAGVLGVPSTPMVLASATWRQLPPPQAALRMLDEIGDAWRDEEAVIVVHPPGRLDLRLVLQALASIVGRERVVDLPLGRTPLSASYATALANVLVPEIGVPLGLVPELLRTVERQITVSAMFSGVSTLETPQPSLLQQVSGYWPTTRFVVHRGRSDRLVRASRRHSTASLARHVAPASHRLLVSLPSGARGWMKSAVASRHDSASTPVAVLTTDPWTTRYWGTSRVVELDGLPPRWRSVVRASIEQLMDHTCSWCAQQVSVIESCDLCSDSPLRAPSEKLPSVVKRKGPATPAADGPEPLVLGPRARTTPPRRRAPKPPAASPAGAASTPVPRRTAAARTTSASSAAADGAGSDEAPAKRPRRRATGSGAAPTGS